MELWAIEGLMSIPLLDYFSVLLVAYIISASWARTDSRYLLVASLILLEFVALAIATGYGYEGGALVRFAFLMFGAAIGAFLFERARSGDRKVSVIPTPTDASGDKPAPTSHSAKGQ
jgi:hypothetical protein